ncbi:ABC transporter permease [Paramicrobacterium agarici]|uniref:Osmoprotectant transport system permease protein n=1 Tax=Paramicrobacterium agarici TaxID=630514 RepID=A0A2A9DVD2_9MICO|nr:ABC transporter permease [Microbacterium agarici]PFG30326.1 osmoprotectant transport system permease protein [Microbacterium agarici]TQO23341.1 osmoprotectant transport system permease protein [Microbacterium agarici]
MSLFAAAFAWLFDPANWAGASGIPVRTLEHLLYTLITLAAAGIVGITMGMYIGHTGKLRSAAVAVTGSLRALPTLGLLFLFALWLGIGLVPVIIVLAILAVPPLLAGTYSGIESIERSTIDSARAMGMTEWQILARVEIPLAMPLIVSGLRSAALQVIATATIAAYLPLGGLGRFVFDNLSLRQWDAVIGGAIIVTLLALIVDGLFALLERGVVSRGVRAARGHGRGESRSSRKPVAAEAA